MHLDVEVFFPPKKITHNETQRRETETVSEAETWFWFLPQGGFDTTYRPGGKSSRRFHLAILGAGDLFW